MPTPSHHTPPGGESLDAGATPRLIEVNRRMAAERDRAQQALRDLVPLVDGHVHMLRQHAPHLAARWEAPLSKAIEALPEGSGAVIETGR